MGCDIHLYVEARGSNNEWASRDKWTKQEATEDEPEYWDVDDEYYGSRNYRLFSILAGVRNNELRGETGEPIVPIAEPRGLPPNVCELVRAISDCMGYDGHSHSWLTLRELMEFNWEQTATLRGWVDGLTYKNWIKWARARGESPSSSCTSVDGGNVQHITEPEMLELLRNPVAIDEILQRTYCQVEWTQPYYYVAQEFLGTVIPRLWKLGSPDNVRIVFWFDN